LADLHLFRISLRDLFRGKRLVAALVLIASPALIAVLRELWSGGKQIEATVVYNNLSGGLIFGFVLVILGVIFGTGVISQEVEQKTITYLLSRSLPRWRIALVKFLAATIAITVTLWLATILLALVTLGPGGLSGSSLGRDLLVLPVGALTYGAVYLLVATVFNRPLLWGLGYAFGWEAWAMRLPGQFQKLSLMGYLRVLAPHPQPEGESVSMGLFGAPDAAEISPTFAWRIMAAVLVVALLLALARFSTREYVPKEDAD